MHRLFLVFTLALLAGCTSRTSQIETQMYWDSQKAELRAEERRLNDLYRAWYGQGFVEGWEGHHSVLHPTGESKDPEGDTAAKQGFVDGQRDGEKAKATYKPESAEQSKSTEGQQ